MELIVAPPPEDVNDPETLRVVIHVKRRHDKPGFWRHQVAAYGLVCWGLGHIGKHWGAGFAPQDDTLRGHAIRRALEIKQMRECPGAKLAVSVVGLASMLDHAARSHGFKTDGKPFHAYALFRILVDERDAGRLVLSGPSRATKKSPEYLAATALAELGYRHAEAFGDHMADAFPDDDHGIYATDVGPDPDGILAAMGGLGE